MPFIYDWVNAMRTIVRSLAFAGLVFSNSSLALDRFNGVDPVDIQHVDTVELLERVDSLLERVEALERSTADDERFIAALTELDAEALLDDEDGANASALLCKVPAEALLLRAQRLIKIAPRLLASYEMDANIEPEFIGPTSILLMTNIARTVSGCEQQALRVVQLARREWRFSERSHYRLFDAAADAVELGLRFRLDFQKYGRSAIDATDMLQAVRLVSKNFTQLQIDEPLHSLQNYEADLERVVATRASPVWRVQGTEDAKLLRRRAFRCGFVAFGDLELSAFPSGTEFLYDQGQKQAAAAWALAQIFQTSEAERSKSELNHAEFVFAAYGKANTQLEIERAARSIRVLPRKDAPSLAYVSFFEHQFIVESGAEEQSSQGKARAYSATEIEQAFRHSRAFGELHGD